MEKREEYLASLHCLRNKLIDKRFDVGLTLFERNLLFLIRRKIDLIEFENWNKDIKELEEIEKNASERFKEMFGV